LKHIYLLIFGTVQFIFYFGKTEYMLFLLSQCLYLTPNSVPNIDFYRLWGTTLLNLSNLLFFTTGVP